MADLEMERALPKKRRRSTKNKVLKRKSIMNDEETLRI